MVKISDAQLAARYQARETQIAAKTHWKGCHFCKLPIQPKEAFKPGTGPGGNACIPCVNKLAPPPVAKIAAPQSSIDCSPSSTDWSQLLTSAQSNLSEAQRQLDESRKEVALLQKEKAALTDALKFFELLTDAAIKLIAQERKFTSTAFMTERLAIKRILIMMNRWTGD